MSNDLNLTRLVNTIMSSDENMVFNYIAENKIDFVFVWKTPINPTEVAEEVKKQYEGEMLALGGNTTTGNNHFKTTGMIAASSRVKRTGPISEWRWVFNSDEPFTPQSAKLTVIHFLDNIWNKNVEFGTMNY